MVLVGMRKQNGINVFFFTLIQALNVREDFKLLEFGERFTAKYFGVEWLPLGINQRHTKINQKPGYGCFAVTACAQFNTGAADFVGTSMDD